MTQNNIVHDSKTQLQRERDIRERTRKKKKPENTRDPLHYRLRLFTVNNKNALQGFVNNATFPETWLETSSQVYKTIKRPHCNSFH